MISMVEPIKLQIADPIEEAEIHRLHAEAARNRAMRWRNLAAKIGAYAAKHEQRADMHLIWANEWDLHRKTQNYDV